MAPIDCPCRNTANNIPVTAPTINPGIAGTLNITRPITIIGANNNTGDNVLKAEANVDLINSI